MNNKIKFNKKEVVENFLANSAILPKMSFVTAKQYHKLLLEELKCNENIELQMQFDALNKILY